MKSKELHTARIHKLTTDCKHFRGIQHTLCAAGINVRDLTGGPDIGWAVRMPCLPSMDRATIAVECTKFCPMTKEEAEKEVAEEDAATGRTLLALKAAHEDARLRGIGKGRGGNGEIKCPCCDTGNISYIVAGYNGHMHARCSTTNCVSWME